MCRAVDYLRSRGLQNDGIYESRQNGFEGLSSLLGLHELWRAGAGPASRGRSIESRAAAVSHRAIELGINFFDTANSYSDGTSEEIVGQARREMARRDEVVVATKVFHPMRKDPNGRGLSRKSILSEIDASLPLGHGLCRSLSDSPLGLFDAD